MSFMNEDLDEELTRLKAENQALHSDVNKVVKLNFDMKTENEKLYRSLEDMLDIAREYLSQEDKFSVEEYIIKAKQALKPEAKQ